MNQLYLFIKRIFIIILMLSLTTSINLSNSFADNLTENELSSNELETDDIVSDDLPTDTTSTEEKVAETPLDIQLTDVNYEVNADATPLNGTTTVTDGGTLTYQWYLYTENEWLPITGETNALYIPNTSVIGEFKYKVIATNTLYDEEDNIISTAVKESNEIIFNITNNTTDSENKENNKTDENNDQNNKDDNNSNKENNNIDKKPDTNNNDNTNKDKKPGITPKPDNKNKSDATRPKPNDKPGNTPPNSKEKMPNKGAFVKQMSKKSNSEQLKTTNNSSTNSNEEEEDTSYKEIELDDSKVDDSVKLKYGEGFIIITINDDSDAPIDLVLTSSNNVIGACLTDSDLKKAYEGETIKIKVISKFITNSVPQADKELIKEGTTALQSQVDGLTVDDYLDISVSKKLGDNNWTKLSDLQKRLQMVLSLPDSITKKDGNKYIIRIHDGEYVLIKDMDNDDSTFTFSTKYFSTYALAFISPKENAQNTNATIKKSNTTYWLIGLSSTLIIIIAIIIILRKRRQVIFR